MARMKGNRGGGEKKREKKREERKIQIRKPQKNVTETGNLKQTQDKKKLSQQQLYIYTKTAELVSKFL